MYILSNYVFLKLNLVGRNRNTTFKPVHVFMWLRTHEAILKTELMLSAMNLYCDMTLTARGCFQRVTQSREL